MRTAVAIRALLFAFALLTFSRGVFAQVSISVNFGPPGIPVYEQPICPTDGYLWVPGYWAYDYDAGYYWVPGTWVEPPQVGFLWTPGYWGWGGSAFIFHEGYWGPQVGFYGGINYGFGYGGVGYEGGRWEGGRFAYNTYVNRVNTTVIHNTYNTRVTYVSESHVSYNGGNGGVEVRPTPQQESYAHEHHVGPVSAQTQHVQQARSNPELRASANEGKPPIAATAKPADFKTGVVASRQAGGAYKAPPPNTARSNEARPANEARPSTENHPANNTGATPNTNGHASELQQHKFTPPNTGNTATDNKYQEQQDKLAAKEAQDHQKLQQQQEKEHQQATKQNYNDTQKQQMEQRHTQQTQQLEQKHATQQQQVQQRQAPHQNAPKSESGPPAQKPH
jgi:WXXGXW repeat (2 copies)